MTLNRALIVCALLCSTALFVKTARPIDEGHGDPHRLSYNVGEWQGADAGSLDDEVRELGADSYINRGYSRSAGEIAGLYVAYYGRQRPGVSIHSPLNCLPGTGWEPLDVATVTLPAAGASAPAIRRMTIEKNLKRIVVFYWYQLHGRVVASEWSAKGLMLYDSWHLGRNDAALVRVAVPVSESIETAQQRGLAFVADLLPHIARVFQS